MQVFSYFIPKNKMEIVQILTKSDNSSVHI